MKFGKKWFLIFAAVLIWSGVNPKDYFTWVLEIFPAIFGAGILLYTCRRFRFTSLVYFLILVHCCILMVGGHYTYAEVPLFDWIRELLGQSRNNYDKVGHFAQGFVPAMIAREIFIRNTIIQGRGWRDFLTVCVCMALSVTYEFFEWGVALLTGASAEAFLGTQGYVWDTQSDMFYATLGAAAAVVFLGRSHDREIREMD